MNRGIRVALAASSGLLLFVAGEPAGVGILAWVALVPLFVAILQERRVVWTWLYGLVFGFAYFAVHLSWIFLFGWMAWTALVAVLALYTSLGTLVAGVVRRSRWAPLLVAGAWTGTDLFRDRWPYGGYSWGAVGTTQGTVPGVRWLAGTVGVYGLTFLCALFAALVAYRIVEGRIAWTSIATAGATLAVFVAVDAALFASPAPGRPVRIAVVQGGVPRPVRPDQRDAILASHIRLTRGLLAKRHVDLVVWPEDSIGIGVSPGAIEKVEALAHDSRTPFLVGESIDEGSQEPFVNTVQYIDANGRIVDFYQKRHPVPFGEYVPIGFFRRFVGTLENQVPYDQTPGHRATVFHVDGFRIATPICFESVFPRDFLDFERKGAELFVLSTNNASFQHSYAAQQHIAHTRMRALETRQWVVQDALAGISGVAAPDGRLSHETRLFTSDAFVADVRARRAPSLYAHTGDVFPEIFASLSAFAAISMIVRRRKRVDSQA